MLLLLAITQAHAAGLSEVAESAWVLGGYLPLLASMGALYWKVTRDAEERERSRQAQHEAMVRMLLAPDPGQESLLQRMASADEALRARLDAVESAQRRAREDVDASYRRMLAILETLTESTDG